MRSFSFLLRGLLAVSAIAVLSVAMHAQSAQTAASQTPPSPEQTKAKTTKKTQEQPTKPAEATPTAEEQKSEREPADDKDKGKEEHFDVSEVAPVVTHHEMTMNGKSLKYTATAGRLPIKRPDGKIEAEMFFVAYTLDGQDPARRPLTFAFNGGPGSASIWLHMGALGPRKVVLKPDGFMPPAPYRIEDNPHTLLDKTDLVLIDAIGTGFSRAADQELFKKFWGVKGDIEAFSEFIRLYITRYERWSSPLYLFGESYGTTRSAGIAGYLADHGISFNGITLLSMVLNFETLEDAKTNDEPYIYLIPSFTMIAGYHHKLAPDLAQDMDKARKESEEFASGAYAQALAKGDALTPDERQKIIDQLSRFTGLSKEIVDEADLRIDVRKFTHYLLIDQKLRVGRLDARYTGPDPDGLMDTPFYDPTGSATRPPFTSVFNNYVRTELGYKTDMPYDVSAPNQSFGTWDWGSAIRGFPDTATALREAIVKNPYLKVLVMEGYYDLATPYYAANYTVDHLNLTSKYRDNISVATYESGHMVYLAGDSLKKMKTDEANFIEKTSMQ
jgi:carboxypeptidase C (cathepsin A)